MKEPNVQARCPVRTTLEMLGGKWSLLIVNALRNGGLRPSELMRIIPEISEKMLMQELKHLQVSELVERKADGDRVFYQLTEKGKLAFPLLEAMRNFARQYEDSLKKV